MSTENEFFFELITVKLTPLIVIDPFSIVILFLIIHHHREKKIYIIGY